MSFIYRCQECKQEFSQKEVQYLCPICGSDYKVGMPLKGVLEVIFDYKKIAKKFDLEQPNWDLFCCVDRKYFPEYVVGSTPFFRSSRLEKKLKFENIWIKNDGLNPSGSLKDRASFLLVAEANRIGEDTLVTASTGNAASALASACAGGGKKAVIFVPASAPKAKLVQMRLAGATVIPVDGTYDDAFALSLQYTKEKGGLNRNTAYHPLTIEGKKTVGLEIFAQNNFQVPDVILVPVGDGVIISGVYKAFYDLQQAKIIDKMPRLICVQAETSNAIHNYIVTGEYKNAPHPQTVADSISVSIPSNAHMARRAVLETEGFSITVSDQEIVSAQKTLANTTGIFAEPTASSVLAALEKIQDQNMIHKKDQIVLLITGHGLKDIDTPLKYLN
ncbi:MAG: threonine synthase [Planctomycetes bacterium]|jgi:threonine synthase|nr:threonine synthase [Planctomycetota bacterium]HPY74940.1 threonine synthase [Planctomycetota bacterium]HQB00632.1 threonine synthase [Planctomycetota bacterium]